MTVRPLAYFFELFDVRGAGLGAGRPPTSIPPIKAKDSMAWFIFDTFMAASPR